MHLLGPMYYSQAKKPSLSHNRCPFVLSVTLSAAAAVLTAREMIDAVATPDPTTQTLSPSPNGDMGSGPNSSYPNFLIGIP